MTARRVGELALAQSIALNASTDLTTGIPRFSSPALADLRALMAESEAWREKCASMTKYAGDMQAECARLRAALENINSQPASAAKVACSMRLIARAALAHEERSGAAASTAGVKP